MVLIVMLCSEREAKASASRRCFVAASTDSLTWVLSAICISVGFFSIAIVGSILFRKQKTLEQLVVVVKKAIVINQCIFVFLQIHNKFNGRLTRQHRPRSPN